MFAAYLTGASFLILLWLINRVIGKSWSFAGLYRGADGRPSSSKFQFFLWTIMVLFAYVTIFSARFAARTDVPPLNGIPRNVLIAMGLSVTTAVAAKGITSSYVTSGQLQKPVVPPPPEQGQPPLAAKANSGLFTDDDGHADLSKMQMLAWTIIGLIVYVFSTHGMIQAALSNTLDLKRDTAVPDIDGALMVLMGLGQAAYIGKKLMTTDTPRLTGISKATGIAGHAVTITGMSFGSAQQGSLITLDGTPCSPEGATWTDTSITATIPAALPAPWTPGQRVALGLVVAGQESANTLPVTL